jgi:hypothetical protein
MIAHKRSNKFDPEDNETSLFEEEVKICRRCKQEYTGSCPIASASCPMENEDASDEEDEGKDFDDVDNLDAVLADDKEADRLTEEEDEIPPEDLADD